VTTLTHVSIYQRDPQSGPFNRHFLEADIRQPLF
jgi:hypothetical protein